MTPENQRFRDLSDVSKAPQERSQTLLETLFGRLWGSLGSLLGALGPFWSAQGPSRGYPRACWGPFLHGFGMDLEVRAAKEDGTHSEPS